MSVYTQLCDICQFILSHVTFQFILSCDICQVLLSYVAYVSLYSVMRHVSVYTQSCDICQFILSCDMCQFILGHATCQFILSCGICQFHIPLLYVIHLEAVDVSLPLFILMCIIMKWVLPRVTFGVMNI